MLATSYELREASLSMRHAISYGHVTHDLNSPETSSPIYPKLDKSRPVSGNPQDGLDDQFPGPLETTRGDDKSEVFGLLGIELAFFRLQVDSLPVEGFQYFQNVYFAFFQDVAVDPRVVQIGSAEDVQESR